MKFQTRTHNFIYIIRVPIRARSIAQTWKTSQCGLWSLHKQSH